MQRRSEIPIGRSVAAFAGDEGNENQPPLGLIRPVQRQVPDERMYIRYPLGSNLNRFRSAERCPNPYV